jgi:hypothetical protein
MSTVIEEKFLNQAVQLYGNEAAGAAETIANGLNALGGPRGIAEVADAFEGYSPGSIGGNPSPSGVSLEAAFSSPGEFFQSFFPTETISNALGDPRFNASQELTAFLSNMFEKNAIENGLAQAGIVIHGKSGLSGMEKGFAIHWNPAGANSSKGFVIYGRPAVEDSEKGFVIDWAPGAERRIIVQKKVSEEGTEKPLGTLSETLQRLRELAPSTPDEEVGIIINGFVQNLQNLMKMKPVLESQKSMSEDLSLSAMSNLRA